MTSRSIPLCDNPQQVNFAMRRYRHWLAWMGGLLLTGLLASAQPGSPSPPPLVLTGGTVIDVANWGESANDLQNAIVIVRGGRITEVGAAGTIPIPKNAQIIDCAGKFIIPGLVDGFAGMNSQAQANANLYMGVTTVAARADGQRGFIDFDAHPSPHIYPIDSVGITDNWSLLARHPEWVSKLRQAGRSVELSPEDTAMQMVATAQLGTRILFLGPELTAANVQWIITRSHQLGMVTYGQFAATPYRVGIAAGVDALPRMDKYILGVIPDELQTPLVDDPDGPSYDTASDYSERIPPTDRHLTAYARFLAGHHAALMPAFSLDYVELPDHRNLWQEPAASLLDPSRMFHPTDRATGEMIYPLPSWSRHMPAVGQRYMEENLQKKAGQSAMRLWRINQTIFSAFPHYLAASGADAMGAMPGISLHTELEMLVRLGLSPREALAAATNNYALQFGWPDLGQVAPGRRADILIVDGDPTINIWNARRISGIILDGNVIDRNALLHPYR
jgi:hypothetical protein